jgi:hypothetical protein
MIGGFDINFNPLRMCIMDLLTIIYIPILYLIIVPWLIFPFSIYEAHKLKTKYIGEDKAWFKSDQWIID